MSFRVKSFSFLAIFLVCVYFLMSDVPFLDTPVSKGGSIPWRNIITWIGFISLPTSIYFGFQSLRKSYTKFQKILNSILIIDLFIAFLWLPIAFLLAGNWTNSFSETTAFQGGQLAMQIFWGLNVVLLVLPIVIFIIFVLITFYQNALKTLNV